jgi:fatty-acyl-CoA synthase
MTETGPIAALAHPPFAYASGSDDDIAWRAKTGRMLHGIDFRIMDGETVLPWDGEAIGEIEVRGPWVTGSYYLDDAPEKFHDGWLRTGDVGTVDPHGYIQITDRAKDVIKSGGEWISTIELENLAVGHPEVLEAAVIGVAHPKWDERPLLVIVRKPGKEPGKSDILGFMEGKVAKWWMPDDVVFVEEIPHTAAGKIKKTALRDQFRDYRLPTH